MSDDITRNSKCRICSSANLEEIISLDETPLANSFLKMEDFVKEKSYPLRVYFCHNCHLAQLLDIVDKKILFSDYVYFYSVMPQAPQHFVSYSNDVIKRFITDLEKELVLEFGSNDGLLLKAFQENGCRQVLGIDPAENIAKFANEHGIPTLPKFFTNALASEIMTTHGKAKVILANNVVAHINDIQDMTKAVNLLLADKGAFIFEAPYLIDMFENLAYDSIYHEHLSYLAVTPLVYLFKQFGMDVFDIQVVNRQGNSIRTFVCHSGVYPISANVATLLKKEEILGLAKIDSYRALASRIAQSKINLVNILKDLKRQGFTIAGYGSPARGNTCLNYCKIGSDLMEFTTEELTSKVGLYTPGMHLPVLHINEARQNPPDYYLMLAWPYKDAILKKEQEFLKNGGKFIIPIGDQIQII